MNSYGEFIARIKAEGLESIGLFYSNYPGKVIKNDDPENLGRVQATCPDLYGEDTFPDWIFPKGVPAGNGNGIFWVPNVGDPIYLSCRNGNVRFPLWEYGWWLRDQTPAGAGVGKQVFLTKFGHRIELNDEDKFIDIRHPSGFHVKLYQDGIYLGKDDKNLGKLLDDLFGLFAATTVATLGGPMPFNNVAAYNILRADIIQFLKTS